MIDWMEEVERHQIPIHCITGVSAGSTCGRGLRQRRFASRDCARGLRHAVRRRGALEHFPHGLRGERAHAEISGKAVETLLARQLGATHVISVHLPANVHGPTAT
jgi:hypothetical protein